LEAEHDPMAAALTTDAVWLRAQAAETTGGSSAPDIDRKAIAHYGLIVV